jgi:hypothetical protein
MEFLMFFLQLGADKLTKTKMKRRLLFLYNHP